jgi:hypothetical protein
MAISFVGSATGTNSIASMPAHQAGDLLLFFAYRDGNITAPSLPSGYTNKGTSSSGSAADASARIGYKIATSSSETSGTWTNATSLICHVYRGVNQTTPLGSDLDGSTYETELNSTVKYPTLTLDVSNGSSWIAAFVGHDATNTNIQTAPTGMTNRTNVVDATDEAAGHDTNGGVSSWTTKSVSVGGTVNEWIAFVFEILAGGSSYSVSEAESSAVADIPAAARTSQSVRDESMTTGGTAAASQVATASRAESTTVGDGPSAQNISYSSVTESAAASDSDQAATITIAEASEGVFISDSLSGSKDTGSEAIESSISADLLGAMLVASVSEASEAAISDNSSANAVLNGSLSESSFSDGLESAQSSASAIGDEISVLTDELTSGVIADATGDESVLPGDGASALSIAQALAENSLLIEDDSQSLALSTAGNEETAEVDEALSGSRVTTSSVTDSAESGDIVYGELIGHAEAIETLIPDESVSVAGATVTDEASEQMNVADQLSGGAILGVALAESAAHDAGESADVVAYAINSESAVPADDAGQSILTGSVQSEVLSAGESHSSASMAEASVESAAFSVSIELAGQESSSAALETDTAEETVTGVMMTGRAALDEVIIDDEMVAFNTAMADTADSIAITGNYAAFYELSAMGNDSSAMAEEISSSAASAAMIDESAPIEDMSDSTGFSGSVVGEVTEIDDVTTVDAILDAVAIETLPVSVNEAAWQIAEAMSLNSTAAGDSAESGVMTLSTSEETVTGDDFPDASGAINSNYGTAMDTEDTVSATGMYVAGSQESVTVTDDNTALLIVGASLLDVAVAVDVVSGSAIVEAIAEETAGHGDSASCVKISFLSVEDAVAAFDAIAAATTAIALKLENSIAGDASARTTARSANASESHPISGIYYGLGLSATGVLETLRATDLTFVIEAGAVNPARIGKVTEGIRIFSVSRNGNREFTIRGNRTGKV